MWLLKGRKRWIKLSWCATLLAGCASQEPVAPKTAHVEAPTTQPRIAEPQPVAPPFDAKELVLKVGERDVLILKHAWVRSEDQAWTHRFNVIEPDDDNMGQRITLQPYEADTPEPAFTCEINEEAELQAVGVTLKGKGLLPELRLFAQAAPGLIPLRWRSDSASSTLQTANSATSHLITDALYDPETNTLYRFTAQTQPIYAAYSPWSSSDLDWAREMDTPIYAFDLPQPAIREQRLLTLTARTLEAPMPALPDPVAGWSDALLRSGNKSVRLERNMHFISANLYASNATHIWSRSLRSQARQSLKALGLQEGEEVLELQRDKPWQANLREAGGAWQRVNNHAPDYNWQHVQEWLAATLAPATGYGLTHLRAPSPLLVSEPLTREHARMLVTLAGLSGRPILLGDDLTQLDPSRIDLLKRILPPVKLRSVDVFPATLPDLWHAAIDDSNHPRHLLGLFNHSLRRQTRAVTLADLGLPVARDSWWAVYDVWQERLIAVVSQRFEIDLEPTTCRLLCVLPLHEDRPTLLGDTRHITMPLNGIEMTPQQDGSYLVSGTRPAVQGESSSVICFVPPHQASFEIKAVQCKDASAVVTADGMMRRIKFNVLTNQTFAWSARFEPAAQTFALPAPPTQLTLVQNTRGALLRWTDIGNQAVRFRIDRDSIPIAHVSTPVRQYQDSDIVYNRLYAYSVTAIDWTGRESEPCSIVQHHTPIPASTNLTELVPLFAEQKHLALQKDRSVDGQPLRMAGRRYYQGLGTHTTSRVAYFLGDGYDLFTGHVGIDDETQGKGSAMFKIVVDGETLFTSDVLRGNDAPQAFSVPLLGRKILELICLPTGDGEDFDHGDWGNPYLHVLAPRQPADQRTPPRSILPVDE